jgi:DNA polymerase III epsilon subunit-like protein
MDLKNNNLKIDRSLVVIDLETSGTNPFVHDVLAIGLVPVFDIGKPTEIYIRPNAMQELQWTEHARKHFEKYARPWKTNAVSPFDACEAIEQYIENELSLKQLTPVGHNIGFDVAFMRKLAFLGKREELRGVSHRAVDTHTLLFTLFLKGLIPSSALSSDGAFSHFGIDVPDSVRHTAIGDALATRDLFLRLLETI